MTAGEIFRRLTGALDSTGIPYMLTGSFASSYHGSPRATQDIDIVISATADQIGSFVGSLPETEYYVSLEAALDALRDEGQFNVIDLATGWKIDLIVRKSRPFSRQEFERRRIAEVQGMRLSIASPEDMVIAKLEWAKLGDSQRQLDDAVGILGRRADELDLDYIRGWIRELGLASQWDTACRASGIASQPDANRLE